MMGEKRHIILKQKSAMESDGSPWESIRPACGVCIRMVSPQHEFVRNNPNQKTISDKEPFQFTHGPKKKEWGGEQAKQMRQPTPLMTC